MVPSSSLPADTPSIGGVSSDVLGGRQVEAIRLVKIARDTAVKAQVTAMITLKAVLVTAADDLRSELEPLSDYRLIQAAAALDDEGTIADPGVAMCHTLKALAQRWLELHEEIKGHARRLKNLTQAAAPELLDSFGIGVDIAAQMLVTAGDNASRVRSEAAFAKMCGASPVPAGSGRTSGRHRLNRGGNRQANPPSIGPSSCECGGTNQPWRTYSVELPRASPRGRSSAASSAIWSGRSSSYCHESPPRSPPHPISRIAWPNRLDDL